MNYQQLTREIERQNDWEEERGRHPATDNQTEPLDSLRRLLFDDDRCTSAD
jgi:hypothetical protein